MTLLYLELFHVGISSPWLFFIPCGNYRTTFFCSFKDIGSYKNSSGKEMEHIYTEICSAILQEVALNHKLLTYALPKSDIFALNSLLDPVIWRPIRCGQLHVLVYAPAQFSPHLEKELVTSSSMCHILYKTLNNAYWPPNKAKQKQHESGCILINVVANFFSKSLGLESKDVKFQCLLAAENELCFHQNCFWKCCYVQ